LVQTKPHAAATAAAVPVKAIDALALCMLSSSAGG
jgi:hypothetical protein